jgi:signal peptidase I
MSGGRSGGLVPQIEQMTMLSSRVPASVHSHDRSRSVVARQAVEFLAILTLAILLFRTFVAEAYIVPSGSMAPTLLGDHEEILCSGCGIRFALGLDDDRQAGKPLCPNCGNLISDRAGAVACSGDRVLVQKLLYDVRRPERWEVAVFQCPDEPGQAYVKRVVGLPGEAIQLVRGDVIVDGQIARKTLREQRAMRVLVHDNNFIPQDIARYPRWVFRRGRPSERLPSGWRREGSRFIHEPAAPGAPAPGREPIDWLEYRHLRADRGGRYAPVTDFLAYNGGDVQGEHQVNDLMLVATLSCAADVRDLMVRIDSGGDRFLMTLPISGAGAIEITRPGQPVVSTRARSDGLALLRSSAARTVLFEASVMDRRLQVSLDGVLLFDPLDYDDPAGFPDADESPLALGVRGGSIQVGGLKVYRDVHYTSSLAGVPRRPFGVDSPYLLGPDEFFVLGDNSAVSNDSRFWAGSPVVPGEQFLGKPFLVHLPGQVFPLQVFGRAVYWVPDPREIRYIR